MPILLAATVLWCIPTYMPPPSYDGLELPPWATIVHRPIARIEAFGSSIGNPLMLAYTQDVPGGFLVVLPNPFDVEPQCYAAIRTHEIAHTWGWNHP